MSLNQIDEEVLQLGIVKGHVLAVNTNLYGLWLLTDARLLKEKY